MIMKTGSSEIVKTFLGSVFSKVQATAKKLHQEITQRTCYDHILLNETAIKSVKLKLIIK